MAIRDELAQTLALCDDYDGCFEAVAEWESTPEHERRDEEYPGFSYEDCEWWKRRADAILKRFEVLELPQPIFIDGSKRPAWLASRPNGDRKYLVAADAGVVSRTRCPDVGD